MHLRQEALLPLLILSACGARDNGNHAITPDEEFDSIPEERVPLERCTLENAWGCGRISTSGNAVRGSFLFDSLFVACSTTNEGTLVSLRNDLTTEATFVVTIGVRGAPRGGFSCMGVELDPATRQPKVDSCEVSVRVHSSVFSASPEAPCIVRFSSGTPLSGSLSCDAMRLGRSRLTLAEGGRFTCPP